MFIFNAGSHQANSGAVLPPPVPPHTRNMPFPATTGTPPLSADRLALGRRLLPPPLHLPRSPPPHLSIEKEIWGSPTGRKGEGWGLRSPHREASHAIALAMLD
eukprot:TRINITY_DN16931_c0_g4_i1.p3 TRINITY_DN16931_c0_g4~~TRINITY_DN16931_c0_g4_i1.p3  ORF type:complete len:103 (-),score=0.15 TRINITY_DN16931_c0_g4_i1:747-1055(-)